MPELPEVETVVQGLRPALEGEVLARVTLNRADLRIPFPAGFAKALEGRRLERLSRRAKYLIGDFDDGTVLIAHLGMSGRMTVHAAGSGEPRQGPHDHVLFETRAGTRVVYSDPRRFGLMTLATRETLESHPLLKTLGLEPLGNALNGPALAERFAGRRTALKTALLDQKIVAGLGNIYAAEALYRARLSPRRLARTVKGERADRLAQAIRAVLQDAIAAGGSTLRDYARSDGAPGYFQHAFAVYGRAGEICATPGCGALVRKLVQGQRSTFYCPQCQR